MEARTVLSRFQSKTFYVIKYILKIFCYMFDQSFQHARTENIAVQLRLLFFFLKMGFLDLQTIEFFEKGLYRLVKFFENIHPIFLQFFALLDFFIFLINKLSYIFLELTSPIFAQFSLAKYLHDTVNLCGKKSMWDPY